MTRIVLPDDPLCQPTALGAETRLCRVLVGSPGIGPVRGRAAGFVASCWLLPGPPCERSAAGVLWLVDMLHRSCWYPWFVVLILMLPCRPCLSMLRCRESEVSPARSDGAFGSAGPGPLLLRPAGGTGGRSFFDNAMLLLLSGRIQAHASLDALVAKPRSGGLLGMARRRRSLTAGMPSQSGAHDVVEVRVPRVPAEYRVGALRIGNQRRRV